MPGKYTILIYAVLLLLGGLQAAYKAYLRKKTIRDAQQAEADRQQTILRTGRDPLAEQVAALQRQAQRDEAEALAQRQEALRQLRTQQQEAAGRNEPPPVPQPTMGGGSGPITRELWPGGPVIVINGPKAAPAPQPRPAQSFPAQPRPAQTRPTLPRPAQTRQQEQRRQSKPQQPRPQPQLRAAPPQRDQRQIPRPQPVRSSLQSRQESRHDAAYYQRERSLAKMQASTNVEDSVVVSAPAYALPSTPQQWRSAFIAAEILGTPVSMRDPESPPGGPSH